MGSQKCEPLGCFIHIQFPDGDSARVWADFDTRSDVNVVNFAAAQDWKSCSFAGVPVKAGTR